ncbi:MAG: alpha/beta hydrolase [Bacteroidetes bacterium]|nr:alpha/beta hydrolase [Bacteroidota bacterium]
MTHCLFGGNDQALSKDMAYGMDPYFEGNLEIKYIPNCSHWVQNDAPQAVNEYLMAFLK